MEFCWLDGQLILNMLFLGSLRSTAQLISYELILSSAILLVVLLAGSLDITVIIEAQRAI